MAPKSSRLEYSPHKRGIVYQQYKRGYKYKTIAALNGIKPLSIPGIISRYESQFKGRSKPRLGRPKILSIRDLRHLFRLIDEDPFISAENLVKYGGLSCSPRTLTRALKKHGIQHQTALRRPKITGKVAEKPLAFARLHIRKPQSWWRRLIVSDESTIARGEGEHQAWVFCRKGERLLPKNVQPKAKPTRHSQMFWGAFPFGIRTSLHPMYGDPQAKHGGVSGRIVLECLQENLPTICQPGSIIMQDNARTHTCAVVQEWLQEWAQENGVELLEWPPFSPDLNPIENVWKLLKAEIIKRFPELADMPKNTKSFNELVFAAITVWEDLPEAILNKLMLTMLRRLQAVIDADGWYTKY